MGEMSKIIVVFRNGKVSSFDVVKGDVKKEFENLKNALVKGIKFYVFNNSIIRLDDVINIFYLQSVIEMFYNIEDEKVRFLVDKSGVQEMTLKEAEIFALKLLNDIDKAR